MIPLTAKFPAVSKYFSSIMTLQKLRFVADGSECANFRILIVRGFVQGCCEKCVQKHFWHFSSHTHRTHILFCIKCLINKTYSHILVHKLFTTRIQLSSYFITSQTGVR